MLERIKSKAGDLRGNFVHSFTINPKQIDMTMKRKHFIASMLVGASSSALLGACGQASDQSKSNEERASDTADLPAGVVVHSVYFWLKEGITEEEELDFLHFFEVLRTIPGVRSLSTGKPAPTTQRDVVDNSFSYLLLVTFDNMDQINLYENHPDHLAAAETYSKYWTKVQVRDVILD